MWNNFSWLLVVILYKIVCYLSLREFNCNRYFLPTDPLQWPFCCLFFCFFVKNGSFQPSLRLVLLVVLARLRPTILEFVCIKFVHDGTISLEGTIQDQFFFFFSIEDCFLSNMFIFYYQFLYSIIIFTNFTIFHHL